MTATLFGGDITVQRLTQCMPEAELSTLNLVRTLSLREGNTSSGTVTVHGKDGSEHRLRVTGKGTSFDCLRPGAFIKIDGQSRSVTAVCSPTELMIDSPLDANESGATYQACNLADHFFYHQTAKEACWRH